MEVVDSSPVSAPVTPPSPTPVTPSFNKYQRRRNYEEIEDVREESTTIEFEPESNYFPVYSEVEEIEKGATSKPQNLDFGSPEEDDENLYEDVDDVLPARQIKNLSLHADDATKNCPSVTSEDEDTYDHFTTAQIPQVEESCYNTLNFDDFKYNRSNSEASSVRKYTSGELTSAFSETDRVGYDFAKDIVVSPSLIECIYSTAEDVKNNNAQSENKNENSKPHLMDSDTHRDDVPPTLQTLPQTLHPVPQSLQSMPQSQQNVPQSQQNVPQSHPDFSQDKNEIKPRIGKKKSPMFPKMFQTKTKVISPDSSLNLTYSEEEQIRKQYLEKRGNRRHSEDTYRINADAKKITAEIQFNKLFKKRQQVNQ